MPEASASPESPDPTLDPVDHLPLTLLRSETIPPAPTRSVSTIDWLPDFGGYSWIAYGASSLLVISHFPSPLSPDETLIGPILRQVLELSRDYSSPVSSVSWSPVTPSVGELAAAFDNCIVIFAHDSATSKGSFCWSQNAVLVQSTKVEAIKWAGSGDGIIAGGIDVVLWRRNNMSWEIAWKLRRDEPQNLVSATWSIEGPSACASSPKESHSGEGNEMSKCVLVCYNAGGSEYARSDLHHPLPVSIIQWRPLTGVQLHGDGQQLRRHVLFSCCLDGTIRLWTQVDSGKVRKLGKDNNDHKPTKRSFCVAAVIEINQALNGTLGSDVFLTWAIEIGGVYQNSEGANEFFASEQHRPDEVGRCEWLIGFGPGKLVTFWAIHCLDDISPLRYPRITLWKRQELQDIDVGHLHRAGSSHFNGALPLEKVVILRNCLSGPPDMCSFIHLTPANSLARSLLYTKRSSNSMGTFIKNCRTDNDSSYSTSGVLSAGHSGKILQVAIHPQTYELVVSLDSNGLLLFWLLSSVLNCYLGLSTLVPAWKLGGRLATNDLGTKYTSLRWAPSILDEDHVLLMGHARGIDCFIVRNSEIGDDIVCYYISTIPLTDDGPYEDGPEYVFTIPLPSICDETFKNNRFLLLAVWTKFFRALSCEVTLHSYDSLEHCHGCNFHDENRSSVWEFEKTLANKRYLLSIKLWSSQFPDPHLLDQITSFCVVCPDNLILLEENLDHKKNLCYGVPAYVMATGWSDGSVKLWRSSPAEDSSNCTPWELVGSFVAHQGPVSAICSNGTGLKIATVSTRSHLEGVSILHIWDTVHLKGTGCFILEDRLSIERPVAALRWLMLGNGQSCLGVCLQNELQIYAQKRCSGQTFWNPEKSLNVGNWSCIAVGNNFPDIHDFLWGPQATAIIIHPHYFSVVGQQLFLVDHKQYAQSCANCSREAFGNREDKDMLCTIFTDCDIECSSLQAPFIKDSSGEDKCSPQEKIDMKSDCPSNCSSVFRAQPKHVSTTMLGFWNLVEIAEKLGGNLPVYHPETLLMNIYSGNWKRAYLSLKHLVEYLSSRHASEASYSYAKSSHIVPQIDLSNYFDGLLLKDSTDKQFQWTADSRLPASSSELSAFDLTASSSNVPFGSTATKSEDSGFAKTLEKFYDLAALSNVEKLQILAIIDLLSEIQHSASAYENLDEPGRRFWVALKFQQLNFSRNFGRLPNVEELVANSRLMSWAFHSDCQETLLSSFLPSEPSWKEMQTLGVGFWFTNVAQLRTKMEKLARLLYLRRKDPKDCALLYIALNRLQVLAGLFKISRDEKDKPLVGFLSRNFQEDKNKAAALKNAYVLMGRHQLEMAVAFFLLGGDTYSAITVCAKNLGDEQLALVLCRLVEGHGGPLEQHLITKFILPSASERGDFWLVSLLEWEMGNYYQSFLSILGPVIDESALSSNHAAFMDPHIGLHCLSLATKNGMRNTIGDQNAAILIRWATFMAAAAFNRCGLPLEALECLSSSPGILAGMDQGSASENDIPQMLNGLLKPSARESNNWLLDDVASLLESHHKLDLGLQYFSKLAREHPSWPETIVESVRLGSFSKENEMHEYEKSLESFKEKLYKGVIKFEQKFLVFSSALIKMISFWLSRIGLWFIGSEILLDHTSQNDPHNKSSKNGNFMVYCHLHKPFLRTAEDISVLLSRFIASCTITCCKREPSYAQNDVSVQDRLSNSQEHCFQGIILMLQSLRAALRIFSGPGSKDLSRLLPILDLYEYYLHFAFAWLQRNSKSLFFMVQPLLITFTNGHTPYEVDMANLNGILHHVPEFSVFAIGNHEGAEVNAIPHLPHRQDAEVMHSFSEDEKWYVIGACLWQYMSRFMDHKLHAMSITYEDLSSVPNGKFLTWASSSNNVGSDGNCKTEKLGSLSLVLAQLLKSTLLHISSYHVKMLGSFLQWKLENRLPISTLGWLKESKPSHSKSPNLDGSLGVVNDIDESTVFERLWITCADPTIVSEGFAQEKINRMEFLQNKSSIEWRDIYAGISREHEMKEIFNHEAKVSNSPSIEEAGSLGKGLLKNSRIFLNSWQKDVTAPKEASYFHNAKEIHKREGELLEALCINSINECQAAVASNRKGIVFFRLEDGMSFGDESKYIWSDADWPPNGWAGANSTPVPTYVSPGVGLGSKKGSHLGLGGATIGMGASARPRRDSTGGGAFGVPGYAGIGSSSIGWEVQEDFEDFVDPPATVENINTRAFSSHPSRPFFLVGSSNTHIYLWEFGKDKATATYGVLPAANVPPPYALASISALQFDHCGHRFATAALDGTVCTWQLEVGGRSNIKPTESSLCFNGYALDVTYVTSSGSVIAASGFSNNGVNVVVWDTLAPPTTSQASIACHEGGARSISVFDNDLGSGSISPLIVTGGKGGDVGLHDFRYIATGRTKRHRHVDNNEASSQVPPNTDNKVGDQNLNGMLWYIPKAHLGSVTKISTIPHTSLFLTGSKDGDVKLWDAKAAKLVYHWPKLHDRHTFLQPSSRGFGGVVRAAVTDIQVVSHGFLTCGGDGTVRLVQLKDFQTGTR